MEKVEGLMLSTVYKLSLMSLVLKYGKVESNGRCRLLNSPFILLYKSQILLIKNVEFTKIIDLFKMFNKIENEISLFTYILNSLSTSFATFKLSNSVILK